MREEFSIIVPVLNREELIVRCLESIKEQTYRPLHVIVVDNGSTDDTFTAITAWGGRNTGADFRMSILRENVKGPSAARNTGLSAVESDHLMFLDSDDTIRPDLVSHAMEAFTANPKADIVTWKCLIHFLNGKTRATRLAHLKDNMAGHIIHSLLRTGGYAIHRRILARAGNWDESIGGWTGWELGIRLLLSNANLVALDEILVDIHRQPKSISGTYLSANKGIWERTLKRGAECISDSDRDDADFLIRLIDYRRVILAAYYRREGASEVAQTLLHQALDTPRLTPMQKRVLKICYRYTCFDGRGASYFAKLFL